MFYILYKYCTHKIFVFWKLNIYIYLSFFQREALERVVQSMAKNERIQRNKEDLMDQLKLKGKRCIDVGFWGDMRNVFTWMKYIFWNVSDNVIHKFFNKAKRSLQFVRVRCWIYEMMVALTLFNLKIVNFFWVRP